MDERVPQVVEGLGENYAEFGEIVRANALTHGDPKAPVRMGAYVQAGRLQIWIANTGPSIPAKAMERLFQPFFRGEVRASQQGLGLGLHIASEIARAHGGTLIVASNEIQTRFTLDVPLGAGEEAATEG